MACRGKYRLSTVSVDPKVWSPNRWGECGGMTTHALFVSSPGGVLLDALALERAWSEGPVRWVAVDGPDTREILADRKVQWIHTEPLMSRPWQWFRQFVDAWRSLGRDRPDWIVSSGTAVAVVWFVAATLRRIPTIWIDTLNMHGGQGRAARICTRLANRVLVQSPDRIRDHRRAVYVGELY